MHEILLDTQIFISALDQDKRTAAAIRKAVQDPANELYLSIASLWEASIKIGLGKLTVPGNSIDSLLDYAEQTGTTILPIRAEHLRLLQDLPRLHRDPFDRMLIVQARAEGLRLASTDTEVHRYEANVLR